MTPYLHRTPPFWPAQHPPCPGTRRTQSVALFTLFPPWRAPPNLPLSLCLSERCLSKPGPSASFLCYIRHLLFVSRMANRFHYICQILASENMENPESSSLLRGNGFREPQWLLPKVQGGEVTGCPFHSFHPYL